MNSKQNANIIYNVERVDTVICMLPLQQTITSSEKSFSSPEVLGSKLNALITASYNCTVKYRKLLNSNENNEENEMSIFEKLHASVQDLYFFYEKNEGDTEANIALSIVSVYNKFFAQFQNFLKVKKSCKAFEVKTEADKTSVCFDDFVGILLRNMA